MAAKVKQARRILPELNLETVDVEELRQHPANPRAADPELIAQSLAAHGQFRAIVISEDGYILAGNHTYQAALSLGRASMQVHRLPIKGDSQQALEIMLADNRTSDFSRYDDAMLARILGSLDEEGVAAAAWERGDVERLIKKLAAEAPVEFPEASPNGALAHTCPRCGFQFDDGAG